MRDKRTTKDVFGEATLDPTRLKKVYKVRANEGLVSISHTSRIRSKANDRYTENDT